MVVIVLGIVALALAAGGAFGAFYYDKRIKRLTATETLDVKELRILHEAAAAAAGPGQFQYRCEVVGAARPERGRVLTSQLKELECVWYRHKVTHKYWETRRDSNGNRKRQQRSKVVSQHTSSEQFLVEDATGSIPVVPHKGIDAPDKVLDHFERDTGGGGRKLRIGSISIPLAQSSGSIGYQHEEWAVQPGRRLFVHGEATDAQGTLVIGPPSDGGLYLVSTRSQDELLSSARQRLRMFSVARAVLAVAGAVLLVAGLITS